MNSAAPTQPIDVCSEVGISVQHVLQGEFATGTNDTICLQTILGSCVAACLYDEESGIGGMNHIFLPGDRDDQGNLTHGVQLMEVLINAIMKAGGSRRSLRAKLFGGAQMVQGFADIGRQNGVFAEQFLEAEGIPCVAKSLGGSNPRRVRFWPSTGKARQQFLRQHTVEEPVRRKVEPPKAGVELF